MQTPIERPQDRRSVYRHALRARPDEMGSGGWHIHYAYYLFYLEEAAMAHLAAVGFPITDGINEGLGGGFLIRHFEIEYRQSAHADDDLVVTTWAESIRGPRLMRCSVIDNPATGQVLAEARAQWIFVEAPTVRPRPVPQVVVDRLTQPVDCQMLGTSAGMEQGGAMTRPAAMGGSRSY